MWQIELVIGVQNLIRSVYIYFRLFSPVTQLVMDKMVGQTKLSFLDGQLEKVKLATVVKGNQKAPFLIDTTLRCRGRHYSFPWIAPLYPWYVPYIAEC